jgi:hypothetical protein
MLCFLCRSNKNFDFLKCFIFDLFSTYKITMPILFQNMVLVCLRIWPEAFNWPGYLVGSRLDLETASKSNPILCAIIYITRESIFKNNAHLDATSVEKNCIKYSEFSVYYIYVSFGLIFSLLLLAKTLTWLLLKIMETLCNWVDRFETSDDICSYFEENISIENEFLNGEKLFIFNGTVVF